MRVLIAINVIFLIIQKCQSLQWLHQLFKASPSSADNKNILSILQKIDKRLDFGNGFANYKLFSTLNMEYIVA
jgi:hypothetical protein